jgi:hypothetical protein
MVMEKKDFVSYRTEEERVHDTTETVTLKLNLKEREDLEADKELLDIGPDGAAIKLLMEIGRKVLHDTFSVRWQKKEGKRTYLSESSTK